MPSTSETMQPDGNPLLLLADHAAHLFISLPESPQGKPIVSREDAGSPSKLLRAMRKQLNLTQREFGVLCSAGGASPISPSVICQLEAGLQAVPPALISRAVAALSAIQRFGEHLAKKDGTVGVDAASIIKGLGPGCIAMLQPYVADAANNVPAAEGVLVGEFLAIVTKRKPSTGGSRPGARGPYRKLNKLNNFSAPATADADAAAAASAAADPTASTARDSNATVESGATSLESPMSMASPASSAASTPCSTPTPSSSRGSSRPRSPLGSEGAPDALVGDNILDALRRLQEENDSLQRENKRLRAIVREPEPAEPTEELPRGDLAMHC